MFFRTAVLAVFLGLLWTPPASGQDTPGFSLGLQAHLSGSQPGITSLHDIAVGPLLRHRIVGPLSGQAGVQVGMVSGTTYRARTVPVEYRLHAGLGPQAVLGLHVFAGGGLRWHRMTEVDAPLHPLLASDEERLRAGPTWALDGGTSAYVPLGLGLTVRMDDRVRMDLQVQYQWTPDGGTLRGQALTHDRWGIGVAFRLAPSQESTPRPTPEPRLQDPPRVTAVAEAPTPRRTAPTWQPTRVAAPSFEAPQPPTRSLPLPVHVRADTLAAGACQYAVQIGTYSSADGALAVAQSAMARTGAGFELIPNGSNNLYAVRTTPHAVASDAARQLLSLRQSPHFDEGIALIEQCAAPDQRPAPVPFEVELWAFADQEAADTRAASLREKLAVEVHVTHVGGRVPYRVHTGPFTDTRTLRTHLQAVRAQDGRSDPDVRIGSHTASQTLTFDYRLQTGQFATLNEALRHARTLDTRHGYPSRLSTDEGGQQVVHLDVPFDSWQAFLDVKRTIDASMSGPASIPVLRENAGRSAVAGR